MNNLKEIKDALKLLGLNANAVKFYLTSFKAGFMSVGKIAHLARIDRSSAYLALEQLRACGLIDERPNKSRTDICVRPPRVLLNRLKTQARKFKNQCIMIEDQMPQLLAQYSEKDNQPVLQFFSGKDGLKQIERDILDCCENELLVFSNQKEEKRVFDRMDHKEFVEERMRKGITVRVLAPDTSEAHQLKAKDHCSLRETRIINEKKIPFTNEIYIYKDKIAMLEFVAEIQGFIVESKAFAEAQRWMFETIWKIHEKERDNDSKSEDKIYPKREIFS